MVPPRVGRRRALRVGGVASAFALAGCLGGGDSSDDSDGDSSLGTVDVDGYTDLLAPDSDEETYFTSLEVVDESLDADIDPRNTEDPMITTPFGAINNLVSESSDLEFAGLSGLVDSQRVGQYETTIDMQIVANGPFALVGDIAPDEIRTMLESAESGEFAFTFEQVDTFGDHLIFEGSSGEETQRVAVSSATIIVAEQRTNIDRVVEAITGRRPRTGEEYEVFDWLLPNDGAHIITGDYSPGESESGSVPERGSLQGITGLVSSLEFEANGVAAEIAAVFGHELDETTRAQVEATFGLDAADPTYEFDSDRVTITGSYDESTLS